MTMSLCRASQVPAVTSDPQVPSDQSDQQDHPDQRVAVENLVPRETRDGQDVQVDRECPDLR